MNKHQTIQAKLRALSEEYGKHLPVRVAEIEKTGFNFLERGRPVSLYNELRTLVHGIAGSAGSYGYKKLGDSARSIEMFLEEYENNLDKLPKDLLTSFIREMKSLLEVKEEVADLVSKQKMPKPNVAPKVYLYFLEENVANDLAHQLAQYDYKSSVFRDFSGLKNKVIEYQPLAILIEIKLLEDINSEHLMSLQARFPDIVWIYVSENGSWTTRIKGVRSGGKGFFTHPIDVNQLVAQLDRDAGYIQEDPFRILIVEDTETLAQYFSAILKQAGMNTEIVTDPFKLAISLVEFKPDLILMDIYMPNCSGLELAQVLRQQASYASIPIVFLSTEEDKFKQLNAMSVGGDDFISKPVIPAYLIFAVKNRASRYRALRELMVRDSLTGVLNHTAIRQTLEVEIQRAQRQSTLMSFVMVDIDHFKKINDTYGHPVGDLVIKSLSTLLVKRLRKTDIIGRYGGEEFAIILPDTSLEVAIKIFDDLRVKFSEIIHLHETTAFSATFSGGVTTVPPYIDANTVVNLADQALYDAKREGRNCIKWLKSN